MPRSRAYDTTCSTSARVYVWSGENAPAKDSSGKGSDSKGKLWSSTMCQWRTFIFDHAIASSMSCGKHTTHTFVNPVYMVIHNVPEGDVHFRPRHGIEHVCGKHTAHTFVNAVYIAVQSCGAQLRCKNCNNHKH